MATVAAADAGKIKVQIPAAEELASHFADDGPPSAVAPMVTVVVSPSYKKKATVTLYALHTDRQWLLECFQLSLAALALLRVVQLSVY